MRGVKNFYQKINDDYSTLTVQSSNYHLCNIMINTCLVEKLKYFTWYRHSNTRYLVAHPSRKCVRDFENNHNIIIDTEFILLHSFILKLFNEEKQNKTDSVDHVSRNEYDNRLINLRWASQGVQNHNRGKVSRKKKAQELPDDLKDIKIPIYVTWNNHSETTKAGKVLQRSFFRIEKHPALGLTDKGNEKIWSSTKSSKVSNIDKFKNTLEQLEIFNSMLPEDPDETIRKINEQSYYELIAQHNEKTFNELMNSN